MVNHSGLFLCKYSMFLLNGKIFFDRTLVWTEDWLGNNNAFVVFDAEVLHDE